MRHAVLLAAAGEGVLTFMDMLVKGATERYPTFEIAFLRFAFGSVFALMLAAALRPGWPTRDGVIYNGTRSVLVVITATSFFFALSRLPLADAIALSFLSPLFMAVFGALLLGETIDRRIGMALAAGFVGMLCIAAGKVGAGGYAGEAWQGVLACIVSAVTYASAIVLLRARAQRDPVAIILLFQSIGPALMLALPAALVWVEPTPADLALFVAVGAIGTIGHYMLALAFARAEAARLAPVHYTTLVWGTLFGYLAFGDVPGLATLIGAALIVAATLATQRSS
jgi:S-adenosylmethionine uptake transporter